jgi:hypothetical protein
VLEAPALARIQREYRDRQVEVIAVNVYPRTPLKEWRAYWKGVGGGDVTFAQDTGLAAARAMRVRSAGATVVFDRQGHVVYRDNRPTSYAELRAAVEKAL